MTMAVDYGDDYDDGDDNDEDFTRLSPMTSYL